MNRPKLLLCGATGFIGRNLLEAFAREGKYDITAVCFKREPWEVPGVRFERVDLTSSAGVNEIIQGHDIVVQAAATTSGAKDIVTRPYYHVTDNAVMNSLILRACFEAKVRHVVFFSCTTMYQSSPKPAAEEDFDGNIIDKYFGVGWTKVYIEKMCEFYSRLGGTKYTVIRHSNVYGPHDKFDLEKSHVFGATVAKVMNASGHITVWGDGSDERDLLYVDDLTDFVRTALERQTSDYELVNVGSGRSVSIKELVLKIIKASGRALTVQYDMSQPTIGFKLSVAIDRARKVFGWTPKTDLNEGIRKTLAWYAQNYSTSQKL